MGLPLRNALDTPQEWNIFRGWLQEFWDHASTLPYSNHARGLWAPGTSYAAGDYVQHSEQLYLAQSNHVSGGNFAADRESGRWMFLDSALEAAVSINGKVENIESKRAAAALSINGKVDDIEGKRVAAGVSMAGKVDNVEANRVSANSSINAAAAAVAGQIQELLDGLNAEAAETAVGLMRNQVVANTATAVAAKNDAVDAKNSAQFLSGGMEFFEAPAQPSFNALDAGAVWDGVGKTQQQFLTAMIDPLVAAHPTYVTRNVLGRDSSNTYDIVEYVFTPPGYTQTALLTSGMHGRETVPVYSMYRFMHYLLNDPDVHRDIRFLRETVRFKIIPSLGVWAGSQTPTKAYTNANGRNIARNFPINREYIPLGDGLGGRGPTALIDAEAVILMNWFKANLNASFYADFHTDYSYYGQLPTSDVWAFRSDADVYAGPVVDATAKRLANRVREKYSGPPLNLTPSLTIEDGLERVSTGKYATEVLGIPFMTSEYSETRYGGRFGGSQDIQNELTMMVNYIAALSRADLRTKINSDKARAQLNYTKLLSKPFNFYSDKANINWGLSALYAKLDALVASTPGYATGAVLGMDASGLYELRAYSLTPASYDRTICVVCGNNSLSGAETVLMLRIMDMLCSEWADYGLDSLRMRTRIVFIPTVNPWGYNLNAPANPEILLLSSAQLSGFVAKSVVNSNGVTVYQQLASGTEAECVLVRNFMLANAFDIVLGLGDTASSNTVFNVRYDTVKASTNRGLADIAVALAQEVLQYKTPFDAGANITLNNNVAANGAFVAAVAGMGFENALSVNMTQSGFRKAGSDTPALNRPTASALMCYLLDLLVSLSKTPLIGRVPAKAVTGARNVAQALVAPSSKPTFTSTTDATYLAAATGRFTAKFTGVHLSTHRIIISSSVGTANAVTLELYDETSGAVVETLYSATLANTSQLEIAGSISVQLFGARVYILRLTMAANVNVMAGTTWSVTQLPR